MTSEEIIEFQRKDREWRKTPIGAAFNKMTSALGRAWVYDTESGFRENASDRRLREVWDAERAATSEFRMLLDAQVALNAEMLAALKRLLATINVRDADNHAPGCRCVIHEARAVIAKAEPAKHPPYPFCHTPERCAEKGRCQSEIACND